MNFTKMQGTGNDFVVLETDDAKRDWAPTAVAMCDRHFGIGADGLLLVMPSKVADFRMRIFNADGSEARACGNGIRCLVRYYVENVRPTPPTRHVTVETMAGVREARTYQTGGRVTSVKIGMGEPRFAAADVPVLVPKDDHVVDIKSMLQFELPVNGRRFTLNALSMGNPHAVYVTDRPVAEFPLSEIGPRVEQSPIFPKGVNFEVIRLVGRDQIEARVWEHGVGETLACGSGACAITVAAQLHGYIGEKAEIKLPGGTLEVAWDGRGEVFLRGPAETVFTGDWPDTLRPSRRRS